MTTGQIFSGWFLVVVLAAIVLVTAGVPLQRRLWGGRRKPSAADQAAALRPGGRRLTPFRHAMLLEHLKLVAQQLDGVTEKTKAPTATGDAATLYLAMQWLVPITAELLLEHAKISPAQTPEEEAPRDKLNERHRGAAAGAFGMAKPQGDRPAV